MYNFRKINIRFFLLFLIFIFTLQICIVGFNVNDVFADISAEEEQQMQQKIQELEEKISQYRTAITESQQQTKTLQGEISIFDNEIERSQLEIQRINLIIQNLNIKIADKEAKIREIERKVDLEKTALAELIREISKYDDVSFLEIILGRDKLSDFISELRSLENFQNQMQNALVLIYDLKEELEQDKIVLKEQKEEQTTLKYIQEEQKFAIDSKKKQKQALLDQTKGQEELFANLVNRTQKDIEAVRGQLYFLKGIVSNGKLSLGEAYQYAKFASIYTGIRPAFLLAILSNESGLGANIGTGTWREDMKPSQRPYYLQICEKLGVSPDQYPVSRKAWYGWGGAMGPAQFLPATWLGYEQRIAEITGNNPPSPWNIKDAFVAAALYLVNKGADQQTYYAEWKSAMIYLAGSNWNKSYLSFYGDDVMALAAQFQEEVDILEGK